MTYSTPTPKLAQVLPHFLARALLRASQTPIPANDPLARVRAIEEVSERIKANYKHYFIKEEY